MQVCGGNAGQLRLAASAYKGDWDAGAHSVNLHNACACQDARCASSSFLVAENSDMVVYCSFGKGLEPSPQQGPEWLEGWRGLDTSTIQ